MVVSNSRSKKIPKFVRKLNQILEESLFQDLIGWLPEQSGFRILNCSRFIEEVLPQYFKHKNMSSFVRQLNMYGFNRPKELNQHVYVHPRFVRQNLNSMRQISRTQSKKKEKKELKFDSPEHHLALQELQSSQLSILRQKLFQQNEKLKEENEKLMQHLQILSQSSYAFSFLPCFDTSFSLETSINSSFKPKQVFFDFQQIVKIQEDFPKLQSNYYQNPACNERAEEKQNCSTETIERN